MVYFLIVVWPILHPACSSNQDISPATWRFEITSAANDEVKLNIIADVAPGWHLYSQHLREGGPIPTKFIFQASNDYTLLGEIEETGDQAKFYDDVYEMDITWYSGNVNFQQMVKLNSPTSTIRGTIVYMTCNDQICVPDDITFAIDVERPKQKR